jgi:ADP-ribosylglycohydrolase
MAVRFLHGSFEEMLKTIAACRGDVDTIGAMAGGIWGAANGAGQLPAHHLASLEQRDRINGVAARLFRSRWLSER